MPTKFANPDDPQQRQSGRPAVAGWPAILDGIDCWLFDMDNTLYPARSSLFPQIDLRMQAFIARLLGVDGESARRVQKDYFRRYGTTLRGLMAMHGVNPQRFLDEVHDVDMASLSPVPELRALLQQLPGRRLVFTNADTPYAERVLERLGISDCFEAIHDVRASDFWPKPDARAYASLCKAHGIRPERTFFADDMARNLTPAKALGMATAWINNGSENGAADYAKEAVDFEIDDLGEWLRSILAIDD